MDEPRLARSRDEQMSALSQEPTFFDFAIGLNGDRGLLNVSRISYDWPASINWTPTCPRSRRTLHHRLSPARSSRTNSSGKDSESSISRSAPPLETSTKVQDFGIMTNAERLAPRRGYFRFSTAMSRCPLIEEIETSSDVAYDRLPSNRIATLDYAACRDFALLQNSPNGTSKIEHQKSNYFFEKVPLMASIRRTVP
jgi:hypothetical protein